MRDFYTAQHAYKLDGKVNDTSLPESTRKALREADEKLRVVTLFYQSELLRIFPLQQGDSLHWHAPGSTELPRGVPSLPSSSLSTTPWIASSRPSSRAIRRAHT